MIWYLLLVNLSKLGAKDAAGVACVSRGLRVSSYEDSLWSDFCSRDLNLSAPLDPHGSPPLAFFQEEEKRKELH